MLPPTALCDACVLYPAPLRDLLMFLAVRGLFRARWSDTIHEEWMRSVLGNRPDLKREQLERTHVLMNTHARDSLVTGFEGLIDSLSLPDPDDQHVLAAAIQAGAEVIVTFNLADFPPGALASHGIEAIHPDLFLSRLIEAAPDEFCAAAKLQRANLKNPPKSVAEFLGTLEACRLPRTVAQLRAAVFLL
ncbi:MAG TPA: PIN domain-containing protein [Gemmataceae bacterium]|nr:PIN domain-containing protein [Gemmataceae bacterium]